MEDLTMHSVSRVTKSTLLLLLLTVAAVCGAAGEAPAAEPESGPIDPGTLPNLSLWLDSSDPQTLYRDGERTEVAAEEGDPVAAWADKSGNGNDAFQEEPFAQPTLVLDGPNGLSVLDFARRQSWYSTSGLAPLFGSEKGWTLFLAIAGPGSSGIVIGSFGWSKSQRGVLMKPSCKGLDGEGNCVRWLHELIEHGTNHYTRFTEKDFEIWEFVAEGHEIFFLANGRETWRRKLPMFAPGMETKDAIGAIPKTKKADPQFLGRFGEILFYEEARTAEERDRLRSYLADKWSIALAGPDEAKEVPDQKPVVKEKKETLPGRRAPAGSSR